MHTRCLNNHCFFSMTVKKRLFYKLSLHWNGSKGCNVCPIVFKRILHCRCHSTVSQVNLKHFNNVLFISEHEGSSETLFFSYLDIDFMHTVESVRRTGKYPFPVMDLKLSKGCQTSPPPHLSLVLYTELTVHFYCFELFTCPMRFVTMKIISYPNSQYVLFL